MVETNLVVIEGDWSDGDFLREVRFMNDEKLEEFITKFNEVGNLYKKYKEEYDFHNYGDLIDWLDEGAEDDGVENAEDYYDFIEEYFPYEGHSQTGCKYITVNYTKVIVDLDKFDYIRI